MFAKLFDYKARNSRLRNQRLRGHTIFALADPQFASVKNAGLGMRSFQKNAMFFSKERNVLAFFCIVFKRTQRSRVLLCSL